MTNIKKLELKQLCGYLPHGLNLKIDTSNWFEKREPFIAKLIGIFDFEHLTVKYLDETDTSYTDNIGRFTPLLLPLSALTEPLPDGTVPIVELAKIIYEKLFHLELIPEKIELLGNDSDGYGCVIISDSERIGLTLDMCIGQFEFNFSIDSAHMRLNQLQLFEYLFSIHFDIYGLIDAGLAVDKRSIINLKMP